MATEVIEEQVVAKLRELSPAKQQQVLEFLESLPKSSPPGLPRKSWYGTLKHLRMDVSLEDIAEVRKEMWAKFPREID